jgi:hypothetical protein
MAEGTGHANELDIGVIAAELGEPLRSRILAAIIDEEKLETRGRGLNGSADSIRDLSDALLFVANGYDH